MAEAPVQPALFTGSNMEYLFVTQTPKPVTRQTITHVTLIALTTRTTATTTTTIHISGTTTPATVPSRVLVVFLALPRLLLLQQLLEDARPRLRISISTHPHLIAPSNVPSNNLGRGGRRRSLTFDPPPPGPETEFRHSRNRFRGSAQHKPDPTRLLPESSQPAWQFRS